MRWSAVICLLWIGMIIGVSFLATPAKFLATNVSLPDALAIGRATFSVFLWVECGFFVALIYVAILDQSMSFKVAALLLVLLGLLGINYLIIQPILDLRVQFILDGNVVEPSQMHRLYVAIEMLKLLWIAFLTANLK